MLQSIEGRAVDFPYMTACDWVAIAAAKRHLENSLEVKEVDLDKEIDREIETRWRGEYLFTSKFRESAKHFFELGMQQSKKRQ